MAHRFSAEQVHGVVHALDGAGVEVIEVSHGDGLVRAGCLTVKHSKDSEKPA